MLRGSAASIGLLSANLRRLAAVPSRVSADAAKAIDGLIDEEFEAGADPYGNAWTPITEVTRARRTQPTAPPLTDTRTMRASTRVKPQRGAGISITIDDPAGIHQTGWSGASSGPARPILPAGTFPARWREAIDASAVKAFGEAVEG